MTISFFTKSRRVALSPRLGAMLALTALLSFGAGAKDARAAVCVECGPPPLIQDFYFSFNAILDGGSVSGGGALVAQQQTPGVWLVTGAFGSLDYVTPSLDRVYGLNLRPTDPQFPTDPIRNNDNLLLFGGGLQLTDHGVTFTVGDGFGLLNIADGAYVFTSDFAGAGTGSFLASPGPAPGTGLAGVALLLLAGAVARARGLLAG